MASDDGVTLVVDVHGSGSVTSMPAGLACDGDACTLTGAPGTTVALTATSAADSAFAGWSGACIGSAATCTVALAQSSSELSAMATFVSRSTSLAVMFAGSGSGSVASAAAGIACSDGDAAGCTAQLAPGTSVALTATPSGSSVFVAWSGGCTGAAATCTTTIGSELDVVTARFEPAGENLIVDVTGQGTVAATPGDIACVAGAGTCAASLPYGTTATLTATPAAGWRFDHWNTVCGADETCQVTLDDPVTIGAAFTQITDSLSVVLAGSGEVVATSSACSGGTCFACPTAGCAAAIADGATVTLTATPGADSELVGWSAPCGDTKTCTLAIHDATTVHATFALLPETLDVALTGTGIGNVRATGSIDCGNGGATCSATVPAATPITLTATPSATSRFVGWSGACSGASTTCVVELHDATTVTAEFGVLTRTLVVEFPQVFVFSGGTIAAEQDQGTVVATDASGATLFECAPSITTCQVPLPVGSQITLTGTPSAGASLHWGPDGGPCSGSAPCTFTLTAATDEVDAVFTRVPVSELDVSVEGDGGDAVDIYSGGVDAVTCNGGCREYIETGAELDLYADASGSPVDIFAEWLGPCFGSSGDCPITLSADTSALADFKSVE